MNCASRPSVRPPPIVGSPKYGAMVSMGEQEIERFIPCVNFLDLRAHSSHFTWHSGIPAARISTRYDSSFHQESGGWTILCSAYHTARRARASPRPQWRIRRR